MTIQNKRGPWQVGDRFCIVGGGWASKPMTVAKIRRHGLVEDDTGQIYAMRDMAAVVDADAE